MISEFLAKNNFTKKEIEKIIKNCNKFFSDLNEEVELDIISIISFLLGKDYSTKEIVRMVGIFPEILTYKIIDFLNKIKELAELGYESNGIHRIFGFYQRILTVSKEDIERIIDYFLKLGIRKEKILRFTTIKPILLGYTVEDIDKEVTKLKKLAFTEEQIIRMIPIEPRVLIYPKEIFLDYISFLRDLDFSLEEALHIISSAPVILERPIDLLGDKIKFLIVKNLRYAIVENPMSLLQSLEVTQARIAYMEENVGPVIGSDARKVFCSSERFKSVFGISNKDLLTVHRIREEMKANKYDNVLKMQKLNE